MPPNSSSKKSLEYLHPSCIPGGRVWDFWKRAEEWIKLTNMDRIRHFYLYTN